MRRDPDERRARILAVVDSVPRGRVASYSQIAREAGLPHNARLVGRILAGLPSRTAIPWHRVLLSSGEISPRPGAARQRQLLVREGVRFTSRDRVDLARHAWRPTSDEPAATR